VKSGPSLKGMTESLLWVHCHYAGSVAARQQA
jgi:hypothetical protein